MKRFITVTGFLLILILVSCQMPLPGPGEDGLFSIIANWGRTIVKTTDSEEGVFIHPTEDGGFVTLIETLTDNTQRANLTNIKAVKLDENGGNDWVFSPSLDLSFIRNGVFILPNPFSQSERYLIGVQKIDQINYNTNVELFYVDENGNQIWHMEYPGSDRDILAGALFTSENTVMVYGKTNSIDGEFNGKDQNSGYDGFVLEIDTANGESHQTYLYDYLEKDNGIKRIYKFPNSSDFFFVGEATNASNIQKIWLMVTNSFHATLSSQGLFKNNDNIQYYFGEMRHLKDTNAYILAATKRTLDEEHMAFYKFTANTTSKQMIINTADEYDANDLIEGDARERSIGLSHFINDHSILAGVKATNDTLTLNRFYLIDTETFEIREQDYQFKQGIIYNHLSKKGNTQLYGLTGSIPSDDPSSDKRVVGGRACWVEGL